MKHLILLSLLFIFLSCKKADELTKFNLEYNTDVTIPAAIALNTPFDIFTPEIETNSSQSFEINDTRKDLVEEIFLKKLTLTIKTPDGKTFDFLNSVEIFINAEGLSEKSVAFKYDIPENIGNTLEINVVDQDLQAYIKKPNFELRVNTVTDEVLTQDVKIDIFSRFLVNAKILGV